CHGPDVQRLQGADAARCLFLSHRSDPARGARWLRGGGESGADGPAHHKIHLAGAAPGHDPGDRSPRFQSGVDAALRSRLHLVAFRLQRRTGPHRNYRAGTDRPRMRVRPNPDEIQRAAKLLVEARMPLMVVGDEIYKAKAAAKAVKLAELLGMPVTQVRQLYANLPETHPLWVGNLAGSSLNSLNYPKSADVIINVGNKFQHNGPAPIVPRGPKFIDMRIDHASMGNVMITEVPLVCDVGYG